MFVDHVGETDLTEEDVPIVESLLGVKAQAKEAFQSLYPESDQKVKPAGRPSRQSPLDD